MDIKYAAKTKDVVADPVYIEGNPVWATITRPVVDLGFVYVTNQSREVWPVYIGWASDDPDADELMVCELYDNADSYPEALKMASELAFKDTDL